MKPSIVIVLLVLAGVSSVAAHSQADEPSGPSVCQTDLPNSAHLLSTNAAQVEFVKADCETRSVYCVGPDGYPVPGELDPDLKSGEELTVKLFGPATCQDVLTVATQLHQASATLFRDVGVTKRDEVLASLALLAKTTATTDAATESITVFVSQINTKLNIEGVTLMVTPRRYYLDVGLLVAFTPYFQQVSTARVPGSKEQFVRETNTIHPSAAITLSYFPAGQYAVPRFSGYHGLGIQAGIGGDLSRVDDEFYLGLVWEPIPGAGISAGLAMLEMERLQPGYPSGALVNPNDVPKDTFLGPRAYFGISLNTEVFQTLLSLGAKARVPH
ncbi:MAG: hypothetical protein WDO69_18845 [Pseudomonadota bacterium]